jgi:SAM-dependent methyltransferase
MRLFWHDYRYFPYERDLARREVECLFGTPVCEADDGLDSPIVDADELAVRRLTYFKGVELASGQLLVPDQARLEASATSNGRMAQPSLFPMPNLRRQSTRYSAHGLHEYRGKFHPQMVRTIGNLLRLEPGATVLDPFCGSGTTLLEAAHLGWNAAGIDLNPLGVYIANAKLIAIRAPLDELSGEAGSLARRLGMGADRISPGQWREVLPNREYLESWFSEAVLDQLAFIEAEISNVGIPALKQVFRVLLSDMCREVSLQDPGDLRIRRRKDADANHDAVFLFTESLRTKMGAVLRAKQQLPVTEGHQQAFLGDSRHAKAVLEAAWPGTQTSLFDAAICSPPYATALPYIDTQRLSLCLLGFIQAKELRGLERALIGNREIGEAERLRLEQALDTNDGDLPDPVLQFCWKLLEKAHSPDHGFRRRNVPSLVFKYFVDMAAMFGAVRIVVRPGGLFALVVGANRTRLQGEEITIDTPQLLATLAAARGWCVEEVLTLDTYHRYDVHQENSIRQERLLLLRRVG